MLNPKINDGKHRPYSKVFTHKIVMINKPTCMCSACINTVDLAGSSSNYVENCTKSMANNDYCCVPGCYNSRSECPQKSFQWFPVDEKIKSNR